MPKRIQIELNKPERLYTKVYLDTLDSDKLTLAQQSVYIAIKSFLPIGNESAVAWPSIETIAHRAKVSPRTAKKSIKELVDLGILEKKRRGQGKTNVYMLHDEAATWEPEKEEKPEDQSIENASTEALLAELAKRGLDVSSLEVGQNKPVEAQEEPQQENLQEQAEQDHRGQKNGQNDGIGGREEQRHEVAPMYDIESQWEEYEEAMERMPEQTQEDVETARSVINDILNRTGGNVIIEGQPRNIEHVKSVLGKLTLLQVLDAIEHTRALGSEVRNFRALLIRNLYRARTIQEQNIIDQKKRLHDRIEAARLDEMRKSRGGTMGTSGDDPGT